jgi:hypothetical protein
MSRRPALAVSITLLSNNLLFSHFYLDSSPAIKRRPLAASPFHITAVHARRCVNLPPDEPIRERSALPAAA